VAYGKWRAVTAFVTGHSSLLTVFFLLAILLVLMYSIVGPLDEREVGHQACGVTFTAAPRTDT
jgi:hypothetical protein